jgi:hypothetical protein
MDLVLFAKMRGSRSNLANRPRVTPAAVTVIIHDLLSNGSILGKESCYIMSGPPPLEVEQTAESNTYEMEVMAYKL